MSKLRPYLADIASAIREKKGSSEPINAKDFSNEIRSIQSGAAPMVEEKDVSFWDYDGTLLYSYTIEEAQALTELPTPPTHEGLVFDGWNWDYEDVIALDYPMDIGALYTTDDGKTRLYLEVEDEDGVDIDLAFRQTANDVAVDFGDGSEVQSSADTNAVIPHHYAKGNYCLMLWSKGGLNNVELAAAADRNVFGAVSEKTCAILQKVEIGQGVKLSGYTFYRCFNLLTITVPKRELNPWGSCFALCTSLKHYNAYKGRLFVDCLLGASSLRRLSYNKDIRVSTGALGLCGLENFKFGKVANFESSIEKSNVTEVVIPTTFTSFANVNNMFKNCSQLKKIVIHSEVTMIPSSCFEECRALCEANIPSSVTEIKGSAFYRCSSLFQLVFPPNLTTIGTNAFFYCGAMKFDFSACQQIPTLGNTGAFSYIPATSKIIVPDALYDAWKAATNWSTYADRIVKASEYNG